MTFKITIPAVKINKSGSTSLLKDTSATSSLPLLPDETMLSPDHCSSLVGGTGVIKLEPIDSNHSSNNNLAVTIPLPSMAGEEDVTNEAEFGEFLLDAVDWL